MSLEGLDWSPIAVERTNWLDRPFIEEEVCKAIFQLDKKRHHDQMVSPWTCFKSVGMWLEDLLRVFMEFQSSGVINRSITFIDLVPQKEPD